MEQNTNFELVKDKQFFYLVGIHIVAMLGCQCPAHGQVDDIPHYCQGESCAQHVFPLTHCGQDWCWESGK